MADDDWKGEHLIRGRRTTGVERMIESRAAGWAVWNATRKKKGQPHPGAKAHAAFAKRVFRDLRGVTV